MAPAPGSGLRGQAPPRAPVGGGPGVGSVAGRWSHGLCSLPQETSARATPRAPSSWSPRATGAWWPGPARSPWSVWPTPGEGGAAGGDADRADPQGPYGTPHGGGGCPGGGWGGGRVPAGSSWGGQGAGGGLGPARPRKSGRSVTPRPPPPPRRPAEELRVTWRRDGVPLAGRTHSFGRRLTLGSPTSTEAGAYACEAATGTGTASARALLSITGERRGRGGAHTWSGNHVAPRAAPPGVRFRGPRRRRVCRPRLVLFALFRRHTRSSDASDDRARAGGARLVLCVPSLCRPCPQAPLQPASAATPRAHRWSLWPLAEENASSVSFC